MAKFKTFSELVIPMDLCVLAVEDAIDRLPLSPEGMQGFESQFYILKHSVEDGEDAAEIMDIMKRDNKHLVLVCELISEPKDIDEWYLERHSIVGNDKYIDVIYSPGA